MILRVMHEAARQRKTAACGLPVQRSIEAYANLLVVLYSRLLNTLSFRLQSHTESSNASNTLGLHATLSTPDLQTHTYMQVSCVKVIFPRSGQKIYSSLFLLAFFDLG